ncbi:hypothetical protein SEA_HUNTINGDON_32 [Arthrobacter phage Huntingdon]|uniref:Uncharacterized protein n=1 Tax=Arthrobacter phage Huntingdon TaxID=2047760 RepID=A0A2H4PAY4_9CAUD|nr:hypothetical protein KDJ00_gp32 [Arthrobacter phage Huntingdon]AOQ28244.1 hypothetical protein SEA_RCIGASTRUGA_32 [Arthrobacter phage RcigaStruga]ATW59239.1 hypothetical protein SEA_HUNTINGDON_32 [Arthrobacter phage Huntingdon]
MERRYLQPRMSSKDYVRKGGAKSIRFTADYWAALRKQRQEQEAKLLRRRVVAHCRFMDRDGQPPLYVFFGGAQELRHWSQDFMLALLEVGVGFEPRQDIVAARPERIRGHRRRLVAVWSSDPTPVGERARLAEIDTMYCIEHMNQMNGYEVSRETTNA